MFILVLIIGVLFLGSGCTSSQYTQSDIDALKKDIAVLKVYAATSYYYDSLQLVIDSLIKDMDDFEDTVESILRENDMNQIEYLKLIIGGHESTLNLFENLSKSGPLIIDSFNKHEIYGDVSDINIILNDIERAIKFLDECYELAEEYIDSKFSKVAVFGTLQDINVHRSIIDEHHYKCLEKKTS